MRIPLLKRLTKDIENPDHDKRRKYGSAKVAVFPRGTKFVAEFFPVTHPHYGTRAQLNLPAWIQVVGGVRVESLEIVKAFMANCEPMDAETFADISALWDYGFTAEEVLNRLLTDKVLTRETVILTLQAIDQEERAKEAAAEDR